MGLRAKPTKLKLLMGNPGRKPLNMAEPEPDATTPQMPEWLRAFPVAVSEWDREITQLVIMRVMTMADAGELASRCYIAAQIQDLAMQIKDDPSIGYTQINALITNYRNLGSNFGLNPSSRSKLTAIQPKEESSLESFRNRKGKK